MRKRRININIDDSPKTEEYRLEAIHAKFPVTWYKSEKKTSLYQTIGQLPKGETTVMVSFANFNAIDVLVYLLEQIGPANLCLTSYAIAENTIRTILNLKKENTIKDLQMLLDSRVPRECPKAYQLVQANFPKHKLVKIHAKIMTIENDNWAVTVSSSANLNENPRIESYIIIDDKRITENTAKWIRDRIME